MNPQRRQLFVILVHHGEAERTHQAITALWRGSTKPTFVVVIDHGEEPLDLSILENQTGDVAGVPRRAPDVIARRRTGVKTRQDPDFSVFAHTQIVRPENNGGFGAGVNVGLGTLVAHDAQARDIVVVMNNDVLVAPEALHNLLQWWETHPDPALVGVRVHERGQTVLGGGRINYWTGRAHLVTDYGLRVTDFGLDYIHGAFFAASYSTLLTLHGMPEQYFLYWEDVLLAACAKRRGIPLRLARSVEVQHVSSMTPPTPQQLYYLVRNGALFMAHETPLPIKLWWRLRNRVRLYYHARSRRQNSVVVRHALRDAISQKTGAR